MTTNLDELRQKRRKWVEANRENGFEDGIKRLLTDLYPDNAHFIYELLQNAEDTHATTVRFALTDSVVIFEHNGEKLFSLKDVESITSIGTSTKRDDPTSIGKFGVGFKAVFAYTNTPEIHSGVFDFRIHDLVIPETDGVPSLENRGKETRFIFPLNNPKKPKQQAVAEIERGLRNLGDNAILFLGHIGIIEYSLPNGDAGSIERVEHGNSRIDIRINAHATHWLRYVNNIDVIQGNGAVVSCRIAVAFKLSKSNGVPSAPDWRIEPLKRGQVSIFFPAEKETSNLKFHIHAPFASTVARDSVRDCVENRMLRDGLAALVVESLSDIKRRGLLTINFLAVLPNHYDSLSRFYEPIRGAIVESFKSTALTPSRDGVHRPTEFLYRGPARIQELLLDSGLSVFSGRNNKFWAKNPPQENQREARFIDDLCIDEWGWKELVESVNMRGLVNPNDTTASLLKNKEQWISRKEDSWLLRFYALLNVACETYSQRLDIRNLRIIRIESDGNTHVIPSNAYFAPSDKREAISNPGILFVKPAVYSEGDSTSLQASARAFLERAGVRTYDMKVVIEKSLEQYSGNSLSIPLDDHIRDIRQFLVYWVNTRGVSVFYRPFLASEVNGDVVKTVYKPDSLYLDEPYLCTGFSLLNHDTVWGGYKDYLETGELISFTDFLKSIGVIHKLQIQKTSITSNQESFGLRNGQWSARETVTGINEDYTIYGIDRYFRYPSIEGSLLVWQALICADSRVAKARYRPNQQCQIREVDSQLVFHLKTRSWIPDGSGHFCKPREISKHELHPDFSYSDGNGLLTAIGFGENAIKRTEEYARRNQDAQRLGFSSAEEIDVFIRLKKSGFSIEDANAFLDKKLGALQPEQSVPNPERRRKHVLENKADAPSKESVKRERSIQKGVSEITAQAKAYLRTKYKNGEGQLICQCCHVEMPFMLRSGEHYFEAKQCIGDKETRHYQNRLALCPTCAAMYQYARETDDAELRRRIVGHPADDQAPSVEIPVRLAGRDLTLYFVGTHWFDLKTVLGGDEAI